MQLTFIRQNQRAAITRICKTRLGRRASNNQNKSAVLVVFSLVKVPAPSLQSILAPTSVCMTFEMFRREQNLKYSGTQWSACLHQGSAFPFNSIKPDLISNSIALYYSKCGEAVMLGIIFKAHHGHLLQVMHWLGTSASYNSTSEDPAHTFASVQLCAHIHTHTHTHTHSVCKCHTSVDTNPQVCNILSDVMLVLTTNKTHYVIFLEVKIYVTP